MPETDSITTETASSAMVNRRALWWPGLAFALAGAAVATVVAAAGRAVGASLEVGGAIPLGGFTQLAFVLSVVGVALAAACRRWAPRPTRAFLWTTLVLLVVSLLPDLFLPDVEAATRLTLVLSHLAVASIVIPGISSRLR